MATVGNPKPCEDAAVPDTADPVFEGLDTATLRDLLDLAAFLCGASGARVCPARASGGCPARKLAGHQGGAAGTGHTVHEEPAGAAACASHEIAAPIRAEDGTFLGALCVFDDRPIRAGPEAIRGLAVLANRIAREVTLVRALERKDALGRETDHRVKNALQSVASFIRLQQRRAGHTDAADVLALAARHLSAIALLHEEMSAARKGSVALQDSMARLATLLCSAAPDGVQLDVAFDPVDVAFEQAAAMAAIANEFVTNAYKHAFPAGRMGRVAIRGTLEADGRVTVVLRDDGVGMASGAGGSGLGMRIMRASAQQLGADLDTAPAPAGTGFAVRLRFTPRP